MWVAGVDGCRGGWVAVLFNIGVREPRQTLLCEDFEAVLRLSPRPEVIAIDMPIGLLDVRRPKGRLCDELARNELTGRKSSVFSPPIRGLLDAPRSQALANGVSPFAFGIVSKIGEVDQWMTPELQHRVFESHPELAFKSLCGRPMHLGKKTREGRKERLRTLANLRTIFPDPGVMVAEDLGRFTRKQVAPDDLLDAYVMTWMASRIAAGTASRLPDDPPLDRKGLRMEIWC